MHLVSVGALNVQEAKPIYDLFSDRLKSSKSGQNLSNILNAKPDPAEVGQIAPEFQEFVMIICQRVHPGQEIELNMFSAGARRRKTYHSL